MRAPKDTKKHSPTPAEEERKEQDSNAGRKTQRAAMANAMRCIGHRSALHWHMHRSALSEAVCYEVSA